LKKVPERGVQTTETVPSTASVAVAEYLTRTRRARRGTRTVRLTRPWSVGGVVSKV
jgi:hypothetical protein